MGIDGIAGPWVVTFFDADVGFREQIWLSAVHNARSKPLCRVTSSPTVSNATSSTELITTPKDTLTVIASTQVHNVVEDPIKRNKRLQGHVTAVIPPKSVSELKRMKTFCPLLENWLEIITGAGTRDEEDKISTVKLSPVNSAELGPVMAKEISNIPLMVELADIKNLPWSRDAFVNVILKGVAITSLLLTPSIDNIGVTSIASDGVSDNSYAKT